MMMLINSALQQKSQQTQKTQNMRRKRARPEKAKGMKDSEDNEIKVLIELWSQYANLFNTKHKNYFNRDARQKSLKNIKLKLKEQNTIATEKQIPVKLINLKNYYGGQKGELIPVKPIALVSIKYIEVT